jgi:Flp pilus assembly protein TadD
MRGSELRVSDLTLWRIALPVGIFLVAMIVRVIAIAQLAHTPFFEGLIIDGREYYDWGLSIARGRLLWNEPLFRAPLYPYLLGLILWCSGAHVLWIYVVQAVLGAASCVLVYWLGGALLGRRIGALAGFAAAVYGPFVFFCARVETVTLVIFLNLLFALVLVRATKEWAAPWWAIAGVLLGVSALAGATIMVLLPVLIVWIAIGCKAQTRRRWACVAALLIGTLFIVGPVVARNSHLAGKLVGIAYSGGINFYKGNNAHYEEVLAIRPGYAWDRLVSEPVKAGEATNAVESSSYFYRKGLRFILTQPLGYLFLVGKKLLIFLNSYEISDNEDIGFIRSHLALFRWPLLGYGIVCPLALVGLVLSLIQRAKIAVLYVMCGLYVATVAVLFFVAARYRLPIVPYFLILASSTIFWIADQVKALLRSPSPGEVSPGELFVRVRSVAFAVTGIVAAWLVVNLDLIGRERYDFVRPHLMLAQVLYDQGAFKEALRELDRAMQQEGADADIHFARAKTYEALGDDQQAMSELEQSLALARDYFEAYVRLGAIAGKIGDMELASEALEHARSLAPFNATVYYYLGLLALKQGNVEEAIDELERAKELGPSYYEVYVQLGLIYGQRGNDAGALREFEAAAELNPASAEVQMSFGVALYAVGRYAEARRAWQKSLEINPIQPQVHYNLACAEAMLGNRGGALRHLGEAVEQGYSDYASVAYNPDLSSLRNEPAFQELLKELRGKQLENVP